MIETTGLIGRDNELQRLNSELVTNSNVLIIAPNGYGKRALYTYLKELADDYGLFNLEMPDDTFVRATKAIVQNYCTKYPHDFLIHPDDSKKLPVLTQKRFNENGYYEWGTLSRFFGHDMGISGIIQRLIYSFYWMGNAQIQNNLEPRKPIIFVKNLRRITDGNTPNFSRFFQQCQVIAILDKQYAHLKHMKRLQNSFQYVLELEPLASDACRLIVKKWLEHSDMSFESEKTEQLFIEHIARDSAGQPTGIKKLLEQAQKEPEITKDKVREFEWEGVQYMSMYPLFMITLAILTVLRTLGRSMGDTTWLVIGAVSGVALMIAFFLRPVLDKEPK